MMVTYKINHQNLKQGLWWILSLQCSSMCCFEFSIMWKDGCYNLSFWCSYWTKLLEYLKKKKKANSIFFVSFHSWVGWEGRSGKQRWFSLQSRLQTEELHGGNVVLMCTIPLDVNGPYEYKVRLACSDYTWRAKLLSVMMMCICFSEGWIASNGFCFQFLCLMWGTSGSWILV